MWGLLPEGGNPPATGDGHQLQRGWESKREIFLSLHKPPAPAVSEPPPPRSPFTFGNKSALRTGTKHGQEKKRTPILRETNQQWAQQVVCGLLGSTQVAFLPRLCAAIEGLQHLRPWHCHLSWDLELLQKTQKTCTSGQKLEAGSTWGYSGGWMI